MADMRVNVGNSYLLNSAIWLAVHASPVEVRKLKVRDAVNLNPVPFLSPAKSSLLKAKPWNLVHEEGMHGLEILAAKIERDNRILAARVTDDNRIRQEGLPLDCGEQGFSHQQRQTKQQPSSLQYVEQHC